MLSRSAANCIMIDRKPLPSGPTRFVAGTRTPS
jgi:hypothetical protein